MKQVIIQHPKETVPISQIDLNKIYATKSDDYIAKLVCVSGSWAFKALHSSLDRCPSFTTAKQAMKSEPYPVYEFDSLNEFAQWVLDNTKNVNICL